MKTISKLASGLALVAISSAAMATGGNNTTGIASTKHNLGSAGSNNHTTSTTEICIFCHTPHGGDQSVSAPIWNRTVSSTSVYTRYSSLGTTTFDANEAPIGSVSIACLSCHDGTQAMDVVINAPGSDSSQFGFAGWSQTSTNGSMGSSMVASDNGVTNGDLVYLGTDLRNDHPVSMQYGGGGITGTFAGSTFDPDYAVATGDAVTPGAPGTNTALGGTGRVNTRELTSGGKRVWWVDTGGTGQQKTDFTLFTRTDGLQTSSSNTAGGLGTAQPYVECATCHDPHSTNSTFLRLPGGNAGSQVCLTCHTK